MEEASKPLGSLHGDKTSGCGDFNYPFVPAPDVIRSNQKDAHFQGVVFDRLSDILRQLYGARFLHNHTVTAKMLSDLVYLGTTTLLGSRTLGEEYCDMVQVEDDTRRLPSLHRRAGYIFTTVFLPFWLARVLPSIRRRLRLKLESSLGRCASGKQLSERARPKYLARTQAYLLAHLDSLTSMSSIYAINLAFFYFTGAYYHLGKRVWGLRYIFTRRLSPSEQRVGYEVLGVLLVVQIVLQSWLHITHQLRSGAAYLSNDSVYAEEEPKVDADNLLYFPSTSVNVHENRIEKITCTPANQGPRCDLHDGRTMEWIEGRQQRKCTLCLEAMRDPSVTTCGHVFCWTCIGDWCREKPECPLCRQTSLPQHILPLRDDTATKGTE